MSRLLCSICTIKSNLLRRELVLSCAIIYLFGFLSLVFVGFWKGPGVYLYLKVDNVLWSSKNDSLHSHVTSFKVSIELHMIIGFSLSEKFYAYLGVGGNQN